jgi:hypothetical protein
MVENNKVRALEEHGKILEERVPRIHERRNG